MHSIEPTFSGMSDRVEKDEEKVQERARGIISSSLEGPSGTIVDNLAEEEQARNVVEKSEKNGASNGAKGSSPAQEEGDTPRSLPAVKAEKAPEMAFRLPMTPRKNVIPSRRPGFDPGRTPSAGPVSAVPANNPARPQAVPATPAILATSVAPAKPVVPVETPLPEVEQSPSQEEVAESPTGQPAASSSESWPDLPTYDGLPAMYHDTSAAEEAWREADQEDEVTRQDTRILPVTAYNGSGNSQASLEAAQRAATADIDTRKIAAPVTPLPLTRTAPPASPGTVKTPGAADGSRPAPVIDAPTTPLPMLEPAKPLEVQRKPLTRKRALLMAALLAILLVNAIAASFNQSFGAQGWATVWGNDPGSNQNLLTQIARQRLHSPTPSGGTATAVSTQSPTQIVNLLLSNMTLDQKIGQMMMVQFTGADYSPQLDAMVSQYKVGSVLFFFNNGNIVSKSQLKSLTAQIQKNAFLPTAISIDQEGGTVDRLINLDGPQPAAATIGATGNTNKAYQQGIKDAQDLASYGFNINLAPVVDVTNVYNPQMYGRTYGNNPTIVTSMAGAYLKGLQKSGKVIGTLKHFPGLGDVSVDPHGGLPNLQRSLKDLNAIDWAPYTNLIGQGNVYAIMVTHEYVRALDSSVPSSLSPKVIGILRNQMHFQGVIMTDSLTMESISNNYSAGQAAAMAVEAGDDMLMGADSPDALEAMIKGIKQAITDGKISEARIDDSVRRILLLKYQMGLIHV
ncbi:MAG TPA: glycoside hydrolase family 3 N-terminal domain-containing protein [Ktedonobacteraceae bacterium]